MEKTDQQVLHQLADKVFAPERVQTMMTALRQRISAAKENKQDHINALNRQLKSAEERQHRLLDAIEMGVVDLDETVKGRAQNLKAAREALVIQIATVRKDKLEIYMRLSLKAQSQCARTIEVLAAMKNPPVVFAKQANISHGNQQVNNGSNPNATHTEKTINQPNELLKADYAALDTRGTATTSGTNQAMEAVAKIHRGEDY